MAERLLSDPPRVLSVTALSDEPLLATESAARTCYQSKIVREAVLSKKRAEGRLDPAKTEKLVRELYDAGHHTTFEHNIFKFEIDRVSRQLVWSFLHSHPFYNTEQQSQRFAPITTDSLIIPEIKGEENQKLLRALKSLK